jgi:osmotically-inducible protein OsmY
MNAQSFTRRAVGSALTVVLVVGTSMYAAPLAVNAQAAGASQAKQQLADGDIAAAVESQLFSDASIPHDDVEVSCQAGIVTLTGTTTNLLARDHAQALAQTVRGVRAVVNRIDVKPRIVRSDEQLRKDVESALAFDPATDAYEVTVSVKDRVAKLTGKVDSYAERSLTEKVASAVQGIRKVENAVAVSYKTARPDSEIREEVKARLRWDAYVRDDFIATAVSQGNVELSGSVGSDAERWRAYYDAWVAGTKTVTMDKLNVAPWLADKQTRKAVQVVGEKEIERAVTAALLYDPRVSSFKVTPDARNGTVTLHGKVDNLQAKRAAIQDARATTGVSRVVDRLHVQSSVTDEAAVAEDIRKAFARDPYVERFEVRVNVNDGTAYLTGTVDSYWEKARADRIASSARGVERVRNRLTVYDDRTPLVYEPRVYDFHPNDFTWYAYEPATWLSDAEIQGEIKDELFWSPYVDANEVKVKVDSGVATLEGTVDSYSELHSALANAFEGGATAVKNDLRVQ